MSELKTLATCKPSEFLRQTNRVKKSVEKWLTDTDILNIRNRMPVLEITPQDASKEERQAIYDRNKKVATEQAKKNISAMLDAILDEHPEETLEVLALCCFVEPENADDHTVGEYLTAFNSLINDKAVIDFFTSLASLAQMNTLNASKA
jgi:hypothetical protein